MCYDYSEVASTQVSALKAACASNDGNWFSGTCTVASGAAGCSTTSGKITLTVWYTGSGWTNELAADSCSIAPGTFTKKP